MIDCTYYGLHVVAECDGPNKVPFIKDSKSYEFLFSESYGETYFGRFRYDPDYKGFEEYKRIALSQSLSHPKLMRITDEYEKCKTKEYFELMRPLGKELSELLNGSCGIKNEHNPFAYRKFIDQHQEISTMDVRFNALLIVVDNKMHTLHPILDVDYETYLKQLEYAYDLKVKEFNSEENKKIEDISNYYKEVYDLIKESLNKGKRVALVHFFDSDIKTSTVDEIDIKEETKSFEKFNIDDYLTSEREIIYWFTK